MRRYCPECPLPETAFVPGQSARPTESLATADSGRNLRLAVDLWNHGYYWEAHEVWEYEWMAAGREGPWADVLKGFIKLAAAGVKCREGRPAGVRHHALRAAEIFQKARADWVSASSSMLVYWDWDGLIAFARRVAANRPIETTPSVTTSFMGGHRVWEWELQWDAKFSHSTHTPEL